MNKTFKVFICPINEHYFNWMSTINIPSDTYLGEMIKEWGKKDKLPTIARDFIDYCYDYGMVYSLADYQNCINDFNYIKQKKVIDLIESYIFITNKY